MKLDKNDIKELLKRVSELYLVTENCFHVIACIRLCLQYLTNSSNEVLLREIAGSNCGVICLEVKSFLLEKHLKS